MLANLACSERAVAQSDHATEPDAPPLSQASRCAISARLEMFFCEDAAFSLVERSGQPRVVELLWRCSVFPSVGQTPRA
jgi:hypothetical protein